MVTDILGVFPVMTQILLKLPGKERARAEVPVLFPSAVRRGPLAEVQGGCPRPVLHQVEREGKIWIKPSRAEFSQGPDLLWDVQEENEPLASGFFGFCFSFLFCLSWTASVAYGNSQARGRVRAIAAGLHHSHSHASVTYSAVHGNARSLTH